MAGRGPAPKDAAARARRNADPAPTRALRLVRQRQPSLPRGLKWHAQTRAWWRTWGKSELAKDFTADDWSFMLDTALMHNEMWTSGDLKLAGEIRLRVAKFGATPEDRLRLRLSLRDPQQLALAEAEQHAAARGVASSGVKQPSKRDDPRSVLKAV